MNKSILWIYIYFSLIRTTIFSFSFWFSLFDLLWFLEPFHWKIVDIFFNEIIFTQWLTSLSTSTFSSLRPFLHNSKIDIFHMLYMIRLKAITHILRYLFIIGRNIQELIQALEKLEVVFIFPRNFCTKSAIFC
jgi:hypothetical protein